jgi:methionine-rich copper-binding protein CopC
MAVAVLGLATAGAALGAADPAAAHNYLVSSTPAAGATLTTLPPEFAITTNDVLLNIDGNGSGFALQVRDSAGRYYGDGCIRISGPSMTTDAALGAGGTYTVTWQVVSTDSHIVSDTYRFTWKPPQGFTASSGSTRVPDCHGTIKPGAPSAGGQGTSASRTVDSGTLQTVLWIGGAFLAVAAAVILTLIFARRGRRDDEDEDGPEQQPADAE